MLDIKLEKELLQKARQANLVSYLESKGYSFRTEGNRRRCNEHESLVITNFNMFYWNSKNSKGNSLDFLIEHLNLDFKKAIAELTSVDLEHKKSPKQVTTAKSNYIATKEHLNRAYAYLNIKRNIDNTIIQNLVEKNYLKMITSNKYKHPNIGFAIFDENKNLIGFELQGTFDKVRFKGITEDAKNKHYGFNLEIGNPQKAYFFESAIDLISFYQLCKHKILKVDLNNSILTSMGGLKVTTLTNTLSAFNITTEPVTCLDNDEAAKQFKETLRNQFIPFKEIVVPNNFKDYNEYLKYKEERA